MKSREKPAFRTRIYHASLTPERLIILCGVGLACIAMIGVGIGFTVNGSSAGNGFMGLGLVLLILAGIFFGPNHRRSLKITEEGLTYDSGKGDPLTIPWAAVMEFVADPPEKKLFRSAILSDGSNEIVVDSTTYREYDQIVSLIEVAMRTHWRGAGTARSAGGVPP